jgi:hypothetical protein
MASALGCCPASPNDVESLDLKILLNGMVTSHRRELMDNPRLFLAALAQWWRTLVAMDVLHWPREFSEYFSSWTSRPASYENRLLQSRGLYEFIWWAFYG